MLTPNQVAELVKAKKEYLAFNEVLIDIFENNLTPYIKADLKKQLSEKSYAQAEHRISPINILPKFIDKITNIYQTGVMRQVQDGTESDKELLTWYETEMEVNDGFNSSNELYNLCKTSLIYPVVREGSPHLLCIPNNHFVVFSDDPKNPTQPTDVVILGEREGEKEIYWVWGKDYFYISDSDERLRRDLMAKYENPDGINPIGRLPFIYVNESKYKLCPTQDADMLRIIKLIPVMLTDLNLAAMFQSFSITYGIDVDDQNLAWSPNAFWRLKSDGTSDGKPQIGMLKPEVDYDQVLKLIETELSMWLQSKGIRAASVGAASADNFSSGFSKIIDEMDTYEARQKQVTKYTCAEESFWDLIITALHPYWVETKQIEDVYKWSPNAKIKTTFTVQLPLQSRGQLVTAFKTEREAGFISRKRAIMKINPEMSEQQIEELIAEIDEERTVAMEEQNGATESNNPNSDGSQTGSEDGTGGPYN